MHILTLVKVISTDDYEDVLRVCSSLTTAVVKVLFLLWLVAPITWNGSDTTHDYVVAPLVKTKPHICSNVSVSYELWSEASELVKQ